MAITTVGTAGTAGGNTATIAPTWPAGTQANDFAIIVWSMVNSVTPNTPTGFTQAAANDTTSGSMRTRVYWKRLTGAESGTITLSNTTSFANRQSATLTVYRGVNTTTGFDAGPVWRAETVSGTTHQNPSVTTVTANSVICCSVHERTSSITSNWTAPTGYTERADTLNLAFGSGGTITANADNLTGVAVGTYTPPVWTSNSATATANVGTYTWALREQPTVTTHQGAAALTNASSMTAGGTTPRAGAAALTNTSTLTAVGTGTTPGVGVNYHSATTSGDMVVGLQTVSAAVPSGAAIGDVMVAFLSRWESGAPTVTAPSGWTRSAEYSLGGNPADAVNKLAIYWKRLTAADTGTYSFSWTGGMYAALHVVRLSGVVASGDPIGTAHASADTGITTATTYPSVQVSPGYTGAGLLWSGYADTAGNTAAPTNFTEVVGTATGYNTTAYRLPGGTAGPYTASGATHASSTFLQSVLVSVQPAAGGGPITHAGAAALSNTSTMTAGGSAPVGGAAALSNVSTMTAGATTPRAGAAALTNTSTLTATAVQTQPAAAALTNTSTLTAAATTPRAGAAALTNVATLTAAGTAPVSGAVALTSVATLTAAATTPRAGAAALTNVSTLTAGGTQAQLGAVALTSVSTLTAVGTGVGQTSANLSSVSTLTVAGLGTAPGAAALTNTATLTAGGTRGQPGFAALTNVATLTAPGTRAQLGAAALMSVSTLTAVGFPTAAGAAALTSVSTLTAAGSTAQPGAATLTSVSTLTATGTTGVGQAGAALTNVSTLTAGGTTPRAGVAALTSVSTLTAGGTRTQFGAVALTSVSTLTATGARTQTGAAALTSVVTLTAAGTSSRPGAAALTSVATFTAGGTAVRVAAASLTSVATLTVAGTSTTAGAAALTSVATLTAVGGRAALGAVQLVSVATLTAVATVQRVGAVGGIGVVYTRRRAGTVIVARPPARVDTGDSRSFVLRSGTAGYVKEER